MRRFIAIVLALVIALTLVLIPAASVRADGPMLAARWNFDVVSAGQVADLSGNGNSGTINGATSVTSQSGFGNAMSFDGIDDYIDCGNNSSLNVASAITLEAWIYLDSATHWNKIVAKTARDGLSYSLGISDIYHGVYFALYNSGVQTFIPGQTTIPLNKWTHIAGTWDGSTMKIFINKVQQAETQPFNGPIDTTTTNLFIGWEVFGWNPPDYQFDGVIDEVRIWNSALTASQLDDMTPPQVNSTNAGQSYSLNQKVEANGSATDGGTGVKSVVTSVTDLDTSTSGPHSFTVIGTDNAMNSTTRTINYSVSSIQFGIKGLQPPYLAPPASFNSGSVIPLKWKYTDQGGNEVDSSNANPVVRINGAVAKAVGDSGYHYDLLTKTWQFNWETKGFAPSPVPYTIQISSRLSGEEYDFLVLLR
jgi:hypothetical protein